MPALAPLKLTLYDPETQERRADFLCNFVPLKYLRLAIRLSRSKANINEDALAGLLVELFGNKFTVDELVDGSSISEREMVMWMIIRRAGSFIVKKVTDEPAEEPPRGTVFFLRDEGWIIEFERAMAEKYGWSVREIEETDIECLLPFIASFGKGKERKRLFADQVRW